MTSGWNFATVWEEIAELRSVDTAITDGARSTSWVEFNARSERLAGYLAAQGLRHGATVAQLLFNCSEYLESVFACLKISLVPVNTNFRYRSEELLDIWRDAEVRAVVFDASLADQVDQARANLPHVDVWLSVGGRTRLRTPPWAVDFEEAIAAGGPAPESRRSGDDLILLYTGGTTGLPKGVMWRQDDLYNALSRSLFRDPVLADLAAVRLRVRHTQDHVRLAAASPIAHSLAFTMTLATLCDGGSIVLPEGPGLDADKLLDLVQKQNVTKLVIVGDAFAKPINDVLDAGAKRDLTSLNTVVSGGALWSDREKSRLLAHLPAVTLIDLFGSSEAFGAASARMSSEGRSGFRVGKNARVVDSEGRDLAPGSGEIGMLVVAGFHPIGYHKDPALTDRLFRTIDGQRYVVMGDYAKIEHGGQLTVLGRGSSVINTGGEKVFPAEVEEAVKRFPGVLDVAVIGVEDTVYGQRVVAVLSVARPSDFPLEQLKATLRDHLAPYKVPREFLFCSSFRNSTGKLERSVLERIRKEQGLL